MVRFILESMWVATVFKPLHDSDGGRGVGVFRGALQVRILKKSAWW